MKLWKGRFTKEENSLANEFNASIGQHSSAGVGISNTADMANILVFLASDESKAINGQIITADYGCNL